ncbi:MAG: tRNA dihydrouridine synthase DusB [Oscillospiraceae bacterium]
MAGVTCSSFRQLCMEYGASFCCSEMVSAKALTYGDRKTFSLLSFTPAERPFGVQIFGFEPEVMAQGARIAEQHCRPDFIDINMGCPAPKITSSGAGSALLKNPELAAEITSAVSESVSVPVTVKLRLGWGSVTAPELIPMLEKAGASAVAVHGRTKAQEYAPPVDLAGIRACVESSSVPVIGNGDIASGEDAAEMKSATGCCCVMVGRAAEGNPFVFRRINAVLRGDPEPPAESWDEVFSVMRRLADGLCGEKGEYIGMQEMRKHAAWFLKGFRGAAALRAQLFGMTKRSDLDDLIDKAGAALSESSTRLR